MLSPSESAAVRLQPDSHFVLPWAVAAKPKLDLSRLATVSADFLISACGALLIRRLLNSFISSGTSNFLSEIIITGVIGSFRSLQAANSRMVRLLGRSEIRKHALSTRFSDDL